MSENFVRNEGSEKYARKNDGSESQARKIEGSEKLSNFLENIPGTYYPLEMIAPLSIIV